MMVAVVRIRVDGNVGLCFYCCRCYYDGLHYSVYSFTSNFELLLTRGIRLFNKNKALRSFFGLKLSLTQCDFCPVL